MQIAKYTQIKLNNCYQNKKQDRINFGNSLETATQLTNVLKNYIKIAEVPNAENGIQTVSECLSKRLQSLIPSGLPLRIVMPAFPFKSPSSQKVLGRSADMAEFDCLRLFKELLGKIGEVYKPGAKLKIYSDGYPIAPIMHVDEEEVQAYSDRVMEFAVRNGL